MRTLKEILTTIEEISVFYTTSGTETIAEYSHRLGQIHALSEEALYILKRKSEVLTQEHLDLIQMMCKVCDKIPLDIDTSVESIIPEVKERLKRERDERLKRKNQCNKVMYDITQEPKKKDHKEEVNKLIDEIIQKRKDKKETVFRNPTPAEKEKILNGEGTFRKGKYIEFDCPETEGGRMLNDGVKMPLDINNNPMSGEGSWIKGVWIPFKKKEEKEIMGSPNPKKNSMFDLIVDEMNLTTDDGELYRHKTKKEKVEAIPAEELRNDMDILTLEVINSKKKYDNIWRGEKLKIKTKDTKTL